MTNAEMNMLLKQPGHPGYRPPTEPQSTMRILVTVILITGCVLAIVILALLHFETGNRALDLEQKATQHLQYIQQLSQNQVILQTRIENLASNLTLTLGALAVEDRRISTLHAQHLALASNLMYYFDLTVPGLFDTNKP